ncbi:MAG TPA: hypothetical protein VLD18_16915, partial [Verrucomicrobiae bacterium]|nr:hypothetical protein [Verrucomicrobiae bacterium]
MSNDHPSQPGSNASLPMPPALPVGEGREEILPIRGLAGALEAILRHPSRVTKQLQSGGPGKLTGAFLLIAMV